MRKLFETQAKGFENRLSTKEIIEYLTLSGGREVLYYISLLKRDGMPIFLHRGGWFLSTKEDIPVLDGLFMDCSDGSGRLTPAGIKNLHLAASAMMREMQSVGQ